MTQLLLIGRTPGRRPRPAWALARPACTWNLPRCSPSDAPLQHRAASWGHQFFPFCGWMSRSTALLGRAVHAHGRLCVPCPCLSLLCCSLPWCSWCLLAGCRMYYCHEDLLLVPPFDVEPWSPAATPSARQGPSGRPPQPSRASIAVWCSAVPSLAAAWLHRLCCVCFDLHLLPTTSHPHDPQPASTLLRVRAAAQPQLPTRALVSPAGGGPAGSFCEVLCTF